MLKHDIDYDTNPHTLELCELVHWSTYQQPRDHLDQEQPFLVQKKKEKKEEWNWNVSHHQGILVAKESSTKSFKALVWDSAYTAEGFWECIKFLATPNALIST